MEVIASTVALARSLGLAVDEPALLRSTNNTVAWMRPSNVVAKVSSTRRAAADELALGRKLADLGAPVVPPADVVGAGVHEVEGGFVTFWRYVDQANASPPSSEAIAVALRALHQALLLVGETPQLPTFGQQLREAIAALERPEFAPLLADPDRALLQDVLEEHLASLQHAQVRVIHGSPHRMNILVVDELPRFIDFEKIQQGPVEWDLAHLEPDVALHYVDPFDDSILVPCRIAVSASTATWCWDAVHRGPDMRTHAELHLARVRSTRG